MNTEYNLIDLLLQLKKWKKQLIQALIAILVISIIGSLLLPNYYKSETTFYAASPDLAKPIPIGDDEKDVRIYGDDNDLDRLFTIATSHEVLYFLVDSFGLYDHYDIDKNDKKSKFKVREELLENYITIKTKYGALSLSVEDKDPKISADMANAAREKIAQLAQGIVKESQGKLITNYTNSIEKKQVLGDSLSNQLFKLKEKAGIFDSKSQAAVYTNLLAEATSDLEDAKGKISFYKKYPTYRDSMIKYMAMEVGASGKLEKAKSELQKYAPVISEVRQLEQEQGRLQDQISLDKERLKQLTATFNAPFTSLHLVESADIPVQKSRPKRSIIVLLATLIGFMLSCLAVFIIENIKGVDLTQKP
jgi:tyrosine-protein kinase Etk/Wzc